MERKEPPFIRELPERNASEHFGPWINEAKKIAFIHNSFYIPEGFKELMEIIHDAFLDKGMILYLLPSKDLLNADKKRLSFFDYFIPYDKDVALLKRLENEGMPLLNSSLGIEIADSKVLTFLALKTAGVPVIPSFISPFCYEGGQYDELSFLDEIEKSLPYPFIIKEDKGSFGEGVHLVNNHEEAKMLIEKLNGRRFLFEPFIKECRGKDIRVLVLNGEIICSYRRENPCDFRSNIALNGKATDYTVDKNTASVALNAVKALGLAFAGVDILMSNDGPLVCEINASPLFLAAKKATGVDVASLLGDYVLSKIDQ